MTKQEISAGLNVLIAVADAVKEAGRIPSGHLYAAICGIVGLQGYESIINTLCNSGVIRRDGQELVWNVS